MSSIDKSGIFFNIPNLYCPLVERKRRKRLRYFGVRVTICHQRLLKILEGFVCRCDPVLRGVESSIAISRLYGPLWLRFQQDNVLSTRGWSFFPSSYETFLAGPNLVTVLAKANRRMFVTLVLADCIETAYIDHGLQNVSCYLLLVR